MRGVVRDPDVFLMDNDVEIPIIRDILKAYNAVYATSVDGIWDVYYCNNCKSSGCSISSALGFTPLFHATFAGRPDIVSLLLQQGANPVLYCCFRSQERKSIHTKSVSTPRTDCLSAMEFALRQSRPGFTYAECYPGYAVEDAKCRENLGECVLMLHAVEVPVFPSFPNEFIRDLSLTDEDLDDGYTDSSSDGDSSSDEYDDEEYDDSNQPTSSWLPGPYMDLIGLIIRGFPRVFKAMVDPLLAKGKGDDQFCEVLAYMLEEACDYQPQDNERKII